MGSFSPKGVMSVFTLETRCTRSVGNADGLPQSQGGAANLSSPGLHGRERTYWHFKDRFYWENEDLNADEVDALL
jgi:hypothetical protein